MAKVRRIPKKFAIKVLNYHFFKLKITKMAKNLFFHFEKLNFFGTPLSFGETIFFSFFILFYSVPKNRQNWKKSLLHTCHICSFWPKNAKGINFHEKIFSRNFSISNFGQKMFSILLTNTYIWTPKSHFAEEGTVPGISAWRAGTVPF